MHGASRCAQGTVDTATVHQTGTCRTQPKGTTVTRTHPTLRTITAVLAVLGLALASCGSDDDGGAITDPDADTEMDDSGDDAAGDDAAGAVEVALHDYAYVGVPESAPAGTQFTVVNESETEAHEFAAFRLADDEDRPVAELAELPPEELGQALGDPATVLVAGPDGRTVQAAGDGTLDEPGRYAVVCMIPTGADPDAFLDAAAEAPEDGPPPDVEGGAPHIAQGMYAELTIE